MKMKTKRKIKRIKRRIIKLIYNNNLKRKNNLHNPHNKNQNHPKNNKKKQLKNKPRNNNNQKKSLSQKTIKKLKNQNQTLIHPMMTHKHFLQHLVVVPKNKQTNQ